MTQRMDPCPSPQPADQAASLSWMLGASFAGALALAISGCGGGGGHGFPVFPPAPAPAPAPAPTSISGVAAGGAAFSNASITVVDKAGATVCNTTTDAQGTYNCDLPISTVPPLVVSAQRGTDTLFSVSANPSGGRVNVTPITSIVVSLLAPNGDPAKLAAGIGSGSTVVDQAAVQAKVAEVVAILKPLLDTLGDSLDPITGAFVADGTGMTACWTPST